jgi:protein-S-isoprenylcysteine O-methyltransferase Ste14
VATDRITRASRYPRPRCICLPYSLWVFGLLLDRRLHIPFLARRVGRVIGSSLIGGRVALPAWFVRTMRGAETTIRIDKPVSGLLQDGPFRYTRKTLAI